MPETIPQSTSNTTKPIGVTGTVIYSGIVDDRERNAKLRGYRKFDTYEDIIRNVHIVAAALGVWHTALSKPDWKARPADENDERANVYADFVNANLQKLKWKRFIRKQSNKLFYGFAAHEWTSERAENGMNAISELDHRQQRTIRYWWEDENRRVVAFRQWDQQVGQYYDIPLWKCVYSARQDTTDSPEGLGLLRTAVPLAEDIQELERVEKVGYRTNLNGIPIFKWPEQAKRENSAGDASEIDAEKRAWESWLRQKIRNEEQGVIFDSATYPNTDGSPSGEPFYSLEFATVDGGSEQYLDDALRRKTLEVARVMGVEHFLVGDNGVGSQSLSTDKSKNFVERVISNLGDLQEDLQDQFVGSLGWMNAWEPELYPILEHEPVDTREIADVASALRDLSVASGPIPQESEAIGQVMDMMGLERLVQDDADMSLMGDDDDADN